MKLLVFFLSCLLSPAEIKPLISSYLGDNQRNFYGNQAPSKLRIKWKTYLGSGQTTFGAEAVQCYLQRLTERSATMPYGIHSFGVWL